MQRPWPGRGGVVREVEAHGFGDGFAAEAAELAEVRLEAHQLHQLFGLERQRIESVLHFPGQWVISASSLALDLRL